VQRLPTNFDDSSGKGKAQLVEDLLDSQGDRNRKRKRKRHRNLSLPIVDGPSEVTLLQSILGSSRFERVASKFCVPISRHWAIQIGGDVFYLSRMHPWIKTSTLPLLSAGARSQIDSRTREEYEAEHGAWSITSSHLGNVAMSRDEIFTIGGCCANARQLHTHNSGSSGQE
jgi:hypothetical protein